MGGRGSGGGGGGSSASSSKMPALQGSEKQVRWANDIRSVAIKAADANVRNAERSKSLGLETSYNNPSVESTKKVRGMVVSAFKEQTSAKAIIDSRDRFSQSQLVKMAAELDRQKGRK